MVTFQVRENGSYTAQVQGTTVAGIEHAGDAFLVHGTEHVADARFSDLQAAQKYIAECTGSDLPASAPARKRNTRTASTSKKAHTVKIASKQETAAPKASKSAKQETAAPRERKVSDVMQRNLAEIAAGNYPVFVADAATLATIQAKHKKLVAAGITFKNGSANIYPSAAVAKKIAALVPGTDTATQCELGGYTPWRNSLRKRASTESVAA